MPLPTFGIHLPTLPFRDNAAVGVAPWAALARLIPDPMLEESAAGQRVAARHIREHKALRDEVQRVLKGTAKGRNVHNYASYIAKGLRGERGNKWSTPPLCLWSSKPLESTDNEYISVLPMDSHVIAIDAETQVAALHLIGNNPDAYDLDASVIDEFQVPFEVHWNISAADAKQIFHDRNWHGVPVAKTLALSMDSFDLATTLAQRLTTDVKVPGPDGSPVELGTFVSKTKRQLGSSSDEWITLSALRSLVVTTLLGRSGIAATANSVAVEDLPIREGQIVDEDQITHDVVDVLSGLFQRMAVEFGTSTAITTPACLAGIGVAANRVMPWTTEQSLTRNEFLDLVDGVEWERKPEIWDGIAGRRTRNGEGVEIITFGGGAKDSGGKVADALLLPDSAAGRQIRGIEGARQAR